MAMAPTRPSWATDNNPRSSTSGLSSIPAPVNPTVPRQPTAINTTRSDPLQTATAKSSTTTYTNDPSVFGLTRRPASSDTTAQNVTPTTAVATTTLSTTATMTTAVSSNGSSVEVNVARQILDSINRGELTGAVSSQLMQGLKKGESSSVSPKAGRTGLGLEGLSGAVDISTVSAPGAVARPPPTSFTPSLPTSAPSTSSSTSPTMANNPGGSTAPRAESPIELERLPTSNESNQIILTANTTPTTTTTSTTPPVSLSPLSTDQLVETMTHIKRKIPSSVLMGLASEPVELAARINLIIPGLSGADHYKLATALRSVATSQTSAASTQVVGSAARPIEIAETPAAIPMVDPTPQTSITPPAVPVLPPPIANINRAAPTTTLQRGPIPSQPLRPPTQTRTSWEIERERVAQLQAVAANVQPSQPPRPAAQTQQAQQFQDQQRTQTALLNRHPQWQPRPSVNQAQPQQVVQHNTNQQSSSTRFQASSSSSSTSNFAQPGLSQVNNGTNLSTNNAQNQNPPQGNAVQQMSRPAAIYETWVTTMQDVAPQLRDLINMTMITGEDSLRQMLASSNDQSAAIQSLLNDKATLQAEKAKLIATQNSMTSIQQNLQGQLLNLTSDYTKVNNERASLQTAVNTQNNTINSQKVVASHVAALEKFKVDAEGRAKTAEEKARTAEVATKAAEEKANAAMSKWSAHWMNYWKEEFEKKKGDPSAEVADLKQKLQKRTDRMTEIETEMVEAAKKHEEEVVQVKKELNGQVTALQKLVDTANRKAGAAEVALQQAQPKVQALERALSESRGQASAKEKNLVLVKTELDTLKTESTKQVQDLQSQLKEMNDELEATKAELATTSNCKDSDDESDSKSKEYKESFKSLVNFAETLRSLHGLPPLVTSSESPSIIANGIRDSFKDTLKHVNAPSAEAKASSLALTQAQQLLETERKRASELEESLTTLRSEIEERLAVQRKRLDISHQEALDKSFKELEVDFEKQYDAVKASADQQQAVAKSLHAENQTLRAQLDQKSGIIIKQQQDLNNAEAAEKVLKSQIAKLKISSTSDDEIQIIPSPSVTGTSKTAVQPLPPPAVGATPTTAARPVVASQPLSSNKDVKGKGKAVDIPTTKTIDRLKGTQPTTISKKPSPPSSTQSTISKKRSSLFSEDEDDEDTVPAKKPKTQTVSSRAPLTTSSLAARSSAHGVASSAARSSPAPSNSSFFVDSPAVAEKFVRTHMHILVKIIKNDSKPKDDPETICLMCWIDHTKQGKLEGRDMSRHEPHQHPPLPGRPGIEAVVQHMVGNHKETLTKLRIKRLREGKDVE